MAQTENTNEAAQEQHASLSEVTRTPLNSTSEPSITILTSEEKKDMSTGIQLETQNSNSETDLMEVHKHPHHVLHQKKWTEYLLEFFMIFFAVFLGFLAETLREHTTENKRAKEFAISMVKELQQDTTELKLYNKYFKLAANNVDTLMQLLSTNELQNIPSGKLYWYGLWGGAHRDFVTNDATFQQMKSSGSLRYFKKNVADQVANYDRFCRLMQENDQKEQGIYVEIRKTRASIFDVRYNDIANNIVQEARVVDNYYKVDSFMKSKPPLLTMDKTAFNQYVELVRSRFLRHHITLSDSLLTNASDLIEKLKNAYSLKEE